MITRPFTLIAFFMRPHIIQSLFGVGAHELTDGYLDLNDVKQIKETGIIDRLLAQPLVNERLELLNNLIRLLGKQADDFTPRVLFALQYLKTNVHANALLALQTELNISERSLQRLRNGKRTYTKFPECCSRYICEIKSRTSNHLYNINGFRPAEQLRTLRGQRIWPDQENIESLTKQLVAISKILILFPLAGARVSRVPSSFELITSPN